MKNTNKDIITQKSIEDKLGFTMKEWESEFQKEFQKIKEAKAKGIFCDCYERDNKPNPLDVLTFEELEYLCKHNYFLD